MEKVVFSVGPYPLMTLNPGLFSLTLFICGTDKTSPPTSKYFRSEKISVLISASCVNRGEVSQRTVIQFFLSSLPIAFGSSMVSLSTIYNEAPLSNAPQISKVVASKTIAPVRSIRSAGVISM